MRVKWNDYSFLVYISTETGEVHDENRYITNKEKLTQSNRTNVQSL